MLNDNLFQVSGRTATVPENEEETGIEVRETLPLPAFIGVRWVPDSDCDQCTSCNRSNSCFLLRILEFGPYQECSQKQAFYRVDFLAPADRFFVLRPRKKTWEFRDLFYFSLFLS